MESSFVPGISIGRATWREILAEFMPSEVMRLHLENCAPAKEQLRDLICFAPVPIGKKQDWLQRLAEAESSDQSAFFTARAEELCQAVDALELKPGEVFHLRKLWCDAPNACVRENAGSGRLFKSLERAVGHIDFSLFTERLETPPEENVLVWFVLEKWTPHRAMEMKRVYRYYFIEKEICFVRKEQGVPDGNGWHSDRHFMQSSAFGPRFHLSVPVSPGDVILVDRRPFQPVVKAAVLTAEHDGFGPLGDEDGTLKTVQDYIAGSEKRGREIWEKLRRQSAR